MAHTDLEEIERQAAEADSLALEDTFGKLNRGDEWIS
jgi:hypothetical protein